MIANATRLMLLFLTTLLISQISAQKQRVFDLSLRHEAEHSILQGLSYLATTQKANGSWNDYPGVTGLALTAFLRAPESVRQQYGKAVQAGLKYLMDNVKPDGGIYPATDPKMESYNTSICLMALVGTNNHYFDDTILRARRFLISLQADEHAGVSPDSSFYGGIGYNKDERSDLSNMQFALEALRVSERFESNPELKNGVKAPADSTGKVMQDSAKDLHWDKAILFLQRSQNLKEYNNYTWSTNDGGFVYYPGNSKAGGTTSYGSMTYAGMKSFIHAGLTKNDDRVQAAYNWIRSNYTVEKNPQLGEQGLFYYYNVMAKALSIYGDSLLVDAAGVSHDWRADLANKLITIQHGNGSWVNVSGRWWENNPDLVTAYCVMVLEEIMK
jgi:squalene-hopene/tetraprenyl-beta-curcumene cyclase